MDLFYRKWIITLFYLIFKAELSRGLAEPSLKAVFMVFRHGDRTPLMSYPNDPHRNYDWPDGFGALSITGIRDMYHLGTTLRKRYSSIFPKNELYSKKYVLARSSDRDRCILSGLSFLAGFMPPPENNPILDIPWQPIPIHPIPQEEDFQLGQDRLCPKYNSTLADAYRINSSDPEISKITHGKADEFFEYLANNTGKIMENLKVVEWLRDTLKVETDNNMTVPEWAKSEETFSIIQQLVELGLLHRGQSKLVQVYGGALLNEMLVNFDTFKNGLPQNIFINSAHDITLVSFLATLDVVNQTAIIQEYGAAVIAELHQIPEIENDFELRFVYFKNNKATKAHRIDIPQCLEPCSLSTFRMIYKLKLVEDYDKVCE